MDKLALSEHLPPKQKNDANSMFEALQPLIPQSLQVASLPAEQPTAKKALSGKLLGRRGVANSYSGRQNDQSRSGGTTSGKNFEHLSKNTFDEKHVAHLLHQVFDDDDAVRGDDRNQQHAANEESDFGLEADYRVSS